MMLDFICIIFCILGIGVHSKPEARNYSIELEENLRTELFSGYIVQQRPSQMVRVSISLTILAVNDLNIKDQTLSLSGYLTLDWDDSRLSWSNTSSTSQDYSSINYLFATEEYIWKPTIIIENAVDGLSVISDTAIPMRIAQSGRVIWNPAGVYKVTCESDTKYYPMDTQSCYLKISSWAYTVSELQLVFKGNPIDTSFYTRNGEWDLIAAERSKIGDKSHESWSFSSLSFLIKLQRRLLFHVVNILFPVALMAILIAFVFKLPAESGEKIGFSLTVLLAYAVYLSLISDHIPSTSITVCFLTLYLAFILLMATIAVGCSTLVINLHMRTELDMMSDGLKRLTINYLLKIANWNNRCVCSRNRVDNDTASYDHTLNGILLTDQTKNEHSASVNCESARDLTWKEVSEILDKVFFKVYMFLIVSSTLVMLIIIVIGYCTA